MTSLELHEYMTPEQHQRWMLMTEEVYFKAKEAIECMLSDGISIIEAVRVIDALYTETINTKDVPF